MTNALFEKYQVSPAIASESPIYEQWVRSHAKEVDIFDKGQVNSVRDLSKIMEEALHKYPWSAVSSNNIWWNATDEPIRVIRVRRPQDKTYVTLVNPQITKYGGFKGISTEGCGSFPDQWYVVKRSTYIEVFACILGERDITAAIMKYGVENITDYYKQERKGLDETIKSFYVQHEIDHLNAIVLPDIGTPHRVQVPIRANLKRK